MSPKRVAVVDEAASAGCFSSAGLAIVITFFAVSGLLLMGMPERREIRNQAGATATVETMTTEPKIGSKPKVIAPTRARDTTASVPSESTTAEPDVLDPATLAAEPVTTPVGKTKAGGKFIFYTQITFQIAFYCDMLASAIYNKVPIQIGQWGRGRVSFRKFNRRLEWGMEYLNTIADDNAIVMCVDAADAFFQESAEDIERKARALLARKNVSIIMSGENDCYIESLKDGGCGDEAFVQSKAGKYRYLNSGLWVGYVGAMKKLFYTALRLVPKLPKKGAIRNDQSVIGLIYSKHGWHKNGMMAIDNDNELFQSFCTKEKDEMAIGGDGYIVNKLYGGRSPIVHFNGPGKSWYTQWRHGFWWSNRPPPMNATLLVDGKLHKFSDVCPIIKQMPQGMLPNGQWNASMTFVADPLHDVAGFKT